MSAASRFVRVGGVWGTREINHDDPFETAVVAVAGLRIRESELAAEQVYGSITNQRWRHHDGSLAAFSFRAAGDMIAAIRGEGDYMTWYCSSPEGVVAPWFAGVMATQGWNPIDDPEDLS